MKEVKKDQGQQAAPEVKQGGSFPIGFIAIVISWIVAGAALVAGLGAVAMGWGVSTPQLLLGEEKLARIVQDEKKGFTFNENKLTLLKAPKTVMEYAVPDGVTHIGKEAFKECANLKQISFADSVTTIGHSAFKSCPNLTVVTLGRGVVNIGDQAFNGCTGLKNISIPAGVTHIGKAAFGGTGCEAQVKQKHPDLYK